MQDKGIEPVPVQRYRQVAGEEFGRFMVRARQRAGLTQQQFAWRLSLRQTEISRLERGNHCPRLDTFVRVIAKLEADPRELLQAIADAYGL
ncbi:MAG TPA: helix-turn-helix transcriptional regulator [Solirubrobacterales bacterium]|nr:helix-turn-helix transcriptional regulator [Solirubrobacterales bacterium]